MGEVRGGDEDKDEEVGVRVNTWSRRCVWLLGRGMKNGKGIGMTMS